MIQSRKGGITLLSLEIFRQIVKRRQFRDLGRSREEKIVATKLEAATA